MERFLTILITSLCLAPLFFLAGAWMVWGTHRSGNSDDSIAAGYSGLFIGTGAAIAAFILAAFLTNHLIGKGYLRPIQLADGVMLIGWLIAWLLYADTQPWALNYADHNAVLDIEVRADSSLLDGEPIDQVVGIRFAESGLSYYQTEQIRREGDMVILPWFTYLHRVADWSVLVDVGQSENLFQMDLPKRPTQSTEWSAWILPVKQPEHPALSGLSIRYRFRLVPYGQDP
ncbi:hypothetical protein [Spirosoma aerolatum]|uniref:hypothetical protein n=1 Tax=Spirosoma aerolatum TaxID=1211326 RepID=UPI0009AEE92E|nr:hypothetical protein [Spirosoma aerolatum]